MPRLKCGAQNCIYNQNRYCSRNRIHVQGSQAIHEDETQCGTFKACDNENMGALKLEMAYIDESNEHLSINCDATNCKFNESELCHKDIVKISGISAKSRQDTSCESFEKNCEKWNNK